MTNTGNLTLTDIVVADDKADNPNVGTKDSLAPGSSETFTAAHLVTQDDVEAGKFTNIAIAEGKNPNGTILTVKSTDPNCSSYTGPGTTVPIFQNPEMTVTKTVVNRQTAYHIGDVVEYRITVANTGNVALTDMAVTDKNADVPLIGSEKTFPLGASAAFTACHTISPADMARGYVLNIALAEAKDTNGRPVTAESTNPMFDDRDPVNPNCPNCTTLSIWTPIAAVEDGYTVTRLEDRQTVGSVLDNDLQDNCLVSPAQVVLSPPDTDYPGMAMDPDGVIRIPGSVVPGRYRYAYRIYEAANQRNCSEATAVIDDLPDRRRLRIPNVFTPNGYGKNDTFEIVGIDGYDRVSLEVMNRFGNQLYRSDDYQNEWDGGNLLDGTYFYAIGLHSGGTQRTVKGWVTLMRGFFRYYIKPNN